MSADERLDLLAERVDVLAVWKVHWILDVLGATVVPTHAIVPAALRPWAMRHRDAQMAGRKVRSAPLLFMPTEGTDASPGAWLVR